jgi:cyclophilin family peptidyl-prolyl cis-trans isomerase
VAGKAWLEAWDRALSASDLEVAGDILRAMLALKIEGAKRAFQAALNSGQIALARLGAKGLKEITGKEVAIPRQSLPKNAAPNLSKYVPLSQGLVAHIKTEVGTIVIRLHSQLAPRTVRNFVDLAKKGYFNGISFHRVVANFVIQGGDPRGDGWGGPGYSIRCENNPLPYRSGTVGMALAGKDTGGSQWFITHSPQPHLLGTYTVFGQVMSGQKVVDTVVEGDKILSITISE